MENISEVTFTELKNPKYIRPCRLNFVQNGKQKTHEVIKNHDSISALIFNISRNVFVFARQFRPSVYVNNAIKGNIVMGEFIDTDINPPRIGITVELCAGLLDKEGLDHRETIKEEILEEIGYNVPLEKLEKIISYKQCLSNCGFNESLYYCEVEDDDKVSIGGGLEEEGEMVEIVEMTPIEAKEYIGRDDIASEPAFIIGINWFFTNKQMYTSGCPSISKSI